MRLLAVLGTLLAALLLSASPASAHTELESTVPAASASVAAPTTIRLTFSEPVRSTVVTVTGADQRPYQTGAARSVDTAVLQDVGPLPAGPVTVAWRTVSADGDPIKGTFTFTNTTAPSPSAAPSIVASPAESSVALVPTAAAAQSETDDGGLSAVWWVAIGVLVVAAAGLVLLGGRRFSRR